MHVIDGNGVNDLYVIGVDMLKREGVLEQTRNGPALVMPTPVTGVYHKPYQRVMLNRKRNANPFFHLYESLWMLAGRQDVASLNGFIGNFGERFAEPDGNVHGAYGHRWRRALGFDQLESIIGRLHKNKNDRQCVLQMWDGRTNGCRAGECDMRYGSNDLLGDWKDRPCNTHIYFRVRASGSLLAGEHCGHDVLDMTICCRSNDIVYGAYGANAVHFSILMEYVAGRLGLHMGTMYQISNNYHGYVSTMPDEVPEHIPYYTVDVMHSLPMGNDWAQWDLDLSLFLDWQKQMVTRGITVDIKYSNDWFSSVAEPMFCAHELWRSGMKQSARMQADTIKADDWRMAAHQWFDARTKK